jgi:glycerol-3-phosphate dehydrogenase
VLRIAAEQPYLAAPIVEGFPDLLAEAVHAARHEQARGIADVLLRRTRLGLLAARSVTAEDTLERLGAVLAQELGWDAAQRAAEVARFQQEAAAEGIVVESVSA